ncbi:MAG: hypothetical protein KME29_30105 [Calothrix sp. FI2-JRJ7]|jgi:hypothetical protein|nr:hypothetical protein [Calothrix sp. FI2-JRJ7]
MIESQGVIGIFSSPQNAESVIKALVEIGGFQPERFFIVADDARRHLVMMSGSLELVKSAKVFLQGGVTSRGSAESELLRGKKHVIIASAM